MYELIHFFMSRDIFEQIQIQTRWTGRACDLLADLCWVIIHMDLATLLSFFSAALLAVWLLIDFLIS
jgi:hypothetical protein